MLLLAKYHIVLTALNRLCSLTHSPMHVLSVDLYPYPVRHLFESHFPGSEQPLQ